MLGKGPAKKVTIYINETAQYHMQSLHDAILTYLMRKGVSGATATRAFAGFGSHQQLHTPKIEVLSMDLPIRIEFVPRLFPVLVSPRPGETGLGPHAGSRSANRVAAWHSPPVK